MSRFFCQFFKILQQSTARCKISCLVLFLKAQNSLRCIDLKFGAIFGFYCTRKRKVNSVYLDISRQLLLFFCGDQFLPVIDMTLRFSTKAQYYVDVLILTKCKKWHWIKNYIAHICMKGASVGFHFCKISCFFFVVQFTRIFATRGWKWQPKFTSLKLIDASFNAYLTLPRTKHESTLLHEYVLNEFLTVDRSCITKYFWKESYRSW